MPVQCDEYNKVCVLGIDGDLSAENAAEIRKQAEHAIDSKQVADFVVDLEHCPFVDSEGLEALLWLKRRSEDLFGQMKVVAVDENCRKILEITRLEPRFECQKDLAAALKMMR